MTKLENKKWQSMYRTKYISNSGDLYLVIDSVFFNINVKINDSTWELTTPNTNYAWRALSLPTNSQNTSIPMTLDLMLNASSGAFVVAQQQPIQRVVVPLEKYSALSMPGFKFPDSLIVNVSNKTWNDTLPLNPDSWMFAPFHIDYAFSKPIQNSCSIRISAAFMMIVLASNALKIAVIYQSLNEPLFSQILTFGDAVSSFLENPDPTTVGFCALEKADIIHSLQNPSYDYVQPWVYERRRFTENGAKERWASNIFM